MTEFELNEIIDDLNQQVQSLEDAKQHLSELQEDTRRIAAGIQMWFETVTKQGQNDD